MLLRALIFSCLVFLSQEQHLSKRAVRDALSSAHEATDAVEQSDKLSSVSMKNEEQQSENIDAKTANVDAKKDLVNDETVSDKTVNADADKTSDSDKSANTVANKRAVNADAASDKDAVSDKAGVNADSASENANQAALNGEANLDLPVNGRRSNRQSKWCDYLKTCRSNSKEICGYDDKVGFGKFKDMCHMMEVNCYWNHDFSLHSCEPMQIKQMGLYRD